MCFRPSSYKRKNREKLHFLRTLLLKKRLINNLIIVSLNAQKLQYLMI